MEKTEKKNRTVLVTGATSFLGRAVIRELESRDINVLAFRHGIEGFREEAAGEKKPAGGTGVEEPDLSPDCFQALIHFGWAGVGSEGRQNEEIQAYNISQSLETLKLAEKLGCRRFLFAGSQAEYSRTSAYGRAKHEFGEQAESWLKSSGGKIQMEFLHLRIFSVYGPEDHESSLISSLIRARKEGKNLELGPCTQDWNYLYVDDLAKMIADLAEREERTEGILDVGSRDTRPLKAFVKDAWKVAGDFFNETKEKEKNETDTGGKENEKEPGLRFGVRVNNAEGAASLCPDLNRLHCLVQVQETDFEKGILNCCRQQTDTAL